MKSLFLYELQNKICTKKWNILFIYQINQKLNTTLAQNVTLTRFKVSLFIAKGIKKFIKILNLKDFLWKIDKIFFEMYWLCQFVS